ncbi:MAG: type I phosphomannose isomerase catalytic subunit [Bacteroidota bacterium]
MHQNLYPLKFIPILKDKIWGGTRLRDQLGKEASPKAGESWEISSFEDNVSVVKNGFLAGNNLDELIEIYMGDLVGDAVYEKFGIEFPLLIKFIDANDDLSIQVHPDDHMALQRHNSFGKTEMWYILDAEPGSKLFIGFNRPLDREHYLEHLNKGTLRDIINAEEIKAGDVYFMPAGRVHAIGAGILLTEIQQTSDLTYRIYDWDRTDENGQSRELHTGLALDAIDYTWHEHYRSEYDRVRNRTNPAVDCPYFTTGVIIMDEPVEKDYNLIDSFIIYICTKGSARIVHGTESTDITMGECVLIPAALKNLTIVPEGECVLLEVYIKG